MIAPDLRDLYVKSTRDLFDGMHPGLREVVRTASPLARQVPTGIRGKLIMLRDIFIVDVLRRCTLRGCWRHGRYSTLLSGRYCPEHWREYYDFGESSEEIGAHGSQNRIPLAGGDVG